MSRAFTKGDDGGAALLVVPRAPLLSSGLLAFTAPLARALLDKRIGDLVELRTPRSVEELEVTEIAYHYLQP